MVVMMIAKMTVTVIAMMMMTVLMVVVMMGFPDAFLSVRKPQVGWSIFESELSIWHMEANIEVRNITFLCCTSANLGRIPADPFKARTLFFPYVAYVSASQFLQETVDNVIVIPVFQESVLPFGIDF